MVRANLELDEQTNRVLNIVKAQHGLKDKSEALNLIVHEFEQEIMEPELRPEFIKKMKKIQEQKAIIALPRNKHYIISR
ncbi:MAG: DUF2683 family protein [Candidatus Aenigmarchaeota archaeon]|nr:DUF2683 family protein [Candidatus Aenigmarchaeota archaeon]